MGGPWRERGFDPAAQRVSRRHGGRRAEVVAHAQPHDGLNRVVLGFITAIVMTFGIVLSLLHRGW